MTAGKSIQSTSPCSVAGRPRLLSLRAGELGMMAKSDVRWSQTMVAVARYLTFAAMGLMVSSLAPAATVTYYYTDAQGTVLAEADSQGSVMETADYRPFGSKALGTPRPGVGFTGHVEDSDSGLVYMQARYYFPETGRFLTIDPVSAAAPERYTYGRNNPFTYSDPDGREAVDKCNIECKRQRQEKERQKGNEVWGIRSGRTLTTVTISETPPGEDGGTSLVREWHLDADSIAGGYVVQKLRATVIGRDSQGNVIVNTDTTFWEAFRVNPGESVARDNDAFFFGGAAGTPIQSGNIRWSGQAAFFEGLKLPSQFAVGNVPEAGQAPSTYVDPNLGAPSTNVTNFQYSTKWPR